MSQMSMGILGGLAVVLSLGAVQLASGRDFAAPANADTASTSSAVNRLAKSDRSDLQMPRTEGRTVAVRLESLPDTSILIRIPRSYRQEARDPGPKPNAAGGAVPAKHVKRAVACEPVVSVLTEVAKQLQPGRCVT